MIEERHPIPPVYIEALIAVTDHAIAVAGLAHFDPEDSQHRYLLSYFVTGIELAGACIALAKHTESVGIPILARSMLEAHVDFKCLLADPVHVECIEAAHDSEWAKMFDEAASEGGTYLGELRSNPLVKRERERIEHRQKHRAALGIRALSAKERFRRAGMYELYYSSFNALSAEAHNNARALISRHFKDDGKGGIRLTIYADAPAFVEVGLLQLRDILEAITEDICKRFGVSEPDRTAVDATFAAAKQQFESEN